MRRLKVLLLAPLLLIAACGENSDQVRQSYALDMATAFLNADYDALETQWDEAIAGPFRVENLARMRSNLPDTTPSAPVFLRSVSRDTARDEPVHEYTYQVDFNPTVLLMSVTIRGEAGEEQLVGLRLRNPQAQQRQQQQRQQQKGQQQQNQPADAPDAEAEN